MLQKLMSWKSLVLVSAILLAVSSCASLDKARDLSRKGQGEEALEMAAKFLDDKEPSVRAEALQVIGGLDTPKAGSIVMPMLDDPADEVKVAALDAIASLRYNEAEKKLIKMVSGSRGDVHAALANTFRKLDPSVMTLLAQKYDDVGEADGEPYLKMFRTIGAPISGALVASLKGKSAFMNRNKFKILVSLRNPKVAEIMVADIGDMELGDLVVDGLIELQSLSTIPVLDALKKMSGTTGEETIKERLITVLGKIKAKAAIETLEVFTKDSSDRVRSAAENSLLMIRGF